MAHHGRHWRITLDIRRQGEELEDGWVHEGFSTIGELCAFNGSGAVIKVYEAYSLDDGWTESILNCIEGLFELRREQNRGQGRMDLPGV